MYSPREIENLFGPDGRTAEVLEDYEPRQAQADMAGAVAGALAEGRHLLAEAGTGVGKSLAYLVPLLDRARETGGRALVSTHTLSLQDQCVKKDLPAALKILGSDAKAVVAMGRANYFCRLRMEARLEGQGGLPGMEGMLQRISSWAAVDPHPVVSRLPFTVPAEVWGEVNVDPYGCPGNRCPHARGCHFLSERQRLQDAALVVSNHALFFSDLESRRRGSRLLPDFDWAVFDEAHHLESVASDHLGIRLAPGQLEPLFRHLDRGDAAGWALEARSALAGFFAWVQARMPPAASRSSTLAMPAGEVSDEGASDSLLRLATRVQELSGRQQDESRKSEYGSAATRLDLFAAGLRDWAGQRLAESVYWAESSPRGLTLRSAPLDLSGLLESELYPRFTSCVLTSATLSTQGNFDFLRRSLGVPPEARALSLPSPFDYESQVEMHLSPNLPDPKRDEEGYLEGLEQECRRALELSQGRAFVLFTSFKHLKRLALRLGPWVEGQGWRMLEQGRGMSREAILEEFKSHGHAVLFGTSSFWEGVDVPGEALSCVVVTRLPFAQPDTPLEQARSRRVQELGGDPFRDLALPQAILRLKQGFGRLVRHRLDQGWFFLLDPRAVTTGYGRAFLNSLPKCRMVVDESAQEEGFE